VRQHVKTWKIVIINLIHIAKYRKKNGTHEWFYLLCNTSRESMITSNLETSLQRLPLYLCGKSNINKILISLLMLIQGATLYIVCLFKRFSQAMVKAIKVHTPRE